MTDTQGAHAQPEALRGAPAAAPSFAGDFDDGGDRVWLIAPEPKALKRAA